jgi:putative transport protein
MRIPAVQWIDNLIPSGTPANGLCVIGVAVVIGLALGAVRVRGIRLGVAGVLFSGLLLAQLGASVSGDAIQFLKDFALIIFMYSIGLQVGPGFVASFKSEGFRLNVLALAVVGLGAVMTAIIVWAQLVPAPSSSGLYSGAFTTTPGLAAGQEALKQKLADDKPARSEAIQSTGLAYAVTYPFGLIGPILTIVILKKMFRIRIEDELAALNLAQQAQRPPVVAVDFEVTNPSQAGMALGDNQLVKVKDVVFARMLRDGVQSVPRGDTQVRLGDIYRAVGPRSEVDEVIAAMGKESKTDLGKIAGDIKPRDLIVTRTAVLRKPLSELNLIRRTGVAIVRIHRSGVTLVPTAHSRLHFGDQVTVVGPEDGLGMMEAELGNSPDQLNRPQLIPIFLGVVLGILVGAIPLSLPHVNVTLKIGLAGGPMLAAIALAQLGNVGSVVWYMPAAASTLFRDFGLAVFLTCVGLQSGDHFIQKVAGGGFAFVLWGGVITILPVLLVGIAARLIFKMNFVTLIGWVAGAMTSSPALLFADDMVKSDAPAVAYAAVAPLAMLFPVICAQLLVFAAK